MPLTLEEARQIVGVFTGDRTNGKVFIAGVVMLAPLIKSFKTDDIIEVTGYTRNVVERVISNLVRFGVWGDDYWIAERPELFVKGFDEVTDEEFQRYATSLLLDAMVGAGELARTKQDDQFAYQLIDT